jgi:ribonuclease P protein component
MRNNPLINGDLKKFKLSAGERVKKKKDFEKIFSEGKVLISSDKKTKAIYIEEKNPGFAGVMIATAVSKKAGSAVWRNRMKRLLKESFRLNKKILVQFCIERNILLKVVFSPNNLNQKNNNRIRLNEVMPGIIELMLNLKSCL